MDAPRLYLMTPAGMDLGTLLPVLERAAQSCELACVLFRFASENLAGEKENFTSLHRLASPLQERGIACLVEGRNGGLVERFGLDGVHIEGEGTELTTALGALKPDYIVGAGGLRTRHAAMIAGEAGADYVMFGSSQCEEPQQQIVAHIAWWGELFNLPCVGYAQDLAAIEDLTRAGADFIALGEAFFRDPLMAEEALHAAARLAERIS